MVYRKTAAAAARKLARRRILLAAATRLFGTFGYHASTVPMIVADAGSSVGSFYSHFRNKEEAFAAVLEELGQKVGAIIRQAQAAFPDTIQRIPSAVESLFLFLAENPGEARILIVESSGLSPRLEQIRRQILRQQAEQICRSLELDSNPVSVLNPAVAAQCLVGAVLEALSSWMEQPPESRPLALDVARAVADYNSRALRRT